METLVTISMLGRWLFNLLLVIGAVALHRRSRGSDTLIIAIGAVTYVLGTLPMWVGQVFFAYAWNPATGSAQSALGYSGLLLSSIPRIGALIAVCGLVAYALRLPHNERRDA